MRKFYAISLVLFCSLFSSMGHGKIIEKKSITIPAKVAEQDVDPVQAAVLFDDALIPPLLILMVLPT